MEKRIDDDAFYTGGPLPDHDMVHVKKMLAVHEWTITMLLDIFPELRGVKFDD